MTKLLVSCAAVGLVLGGGARWLDSQQCWQAELPSSQCLQQQPSLQAIQGMGMGLMAGLGAAVGVVLQMRQED